MLALLATFNALCAAIYTALCAQSGSPWFIYGAVAHGLFLLINLVQMAADS